MKKYLLALFIVISTLIKAQNNGKTNTTFYNLENNIAIQGYDPVSYFTINKATKGSPKTSSKHNGVTYYFSSESNKKIFNANPEKYEPQYGGWCAFAIGNSGEKIKIDPNTFKLIDGKLYLFYNFYFTNTLKSWNKDEKKLKNKADYNWKIINKKGEN